MVDFAYNLAIETSSRQGAIALGRGDQMLCAIDLPTPRRHRVDLMPSIADLCDKHQIKPADIGEIYVSIGPGSFTGLRIAVTTAKVISMITGAKIIAVPTLDVVAQNVQPSDDLLAVALNHKNKTVYGGLYQHDGSHWSLISKPNVQNLEQLLNSPTPGSSPENFSGCDHEIGNVISGGRKIQLLGEALPPEVFPELGENFRGGGSQNSSCDELVVLDSALAKPQAKFVWQIGQRLASDPQDTDAYALVPLYAREPEAVKLWEQNKNKRVNCA
ncbi:MAG: tRNA (adenosine(37)-N6)-threonylcarbamoyltransferase complex dimerization subunit type 1 TsaB [Phycisphaeraceae bacterium]|nr:tRNA (adenosine(37)-N6)-threonylcarbamoyltransferase complex dimerization subunit type 1 TsaB [Phycisphaeraceae bacterium]